jgi:hypothetical protein
MTTRQWGILSCGDKNVIKMILIDRIGTSETLAPFSRVNNKLISRANCLFSAIHIEHLVRYKKEKVPSKEYRPE